MSCGVTVASIERRNQALRKREVRRLEALIRVAEICREAPLLLVHEEPSLSCKSGDKEQRQRPRRDVPVRENKKGDGRAIERHGCHNNRKELGERFGK